MIQELKPSFQTQVYGKWILCGEHAVLRGSPAIVFPVTEKSFKLSYFASQQDLTAEFSGERGEEMRVLFWGVFDRAIELVRQSRSAVRGTFHVENSIPVGAGMGASAALCVAIGKWILWKGWIQQQALYEFSRQLENLFHGESSGVDIAVAISGQGLYFKRNGERHSLKPTWKPSWYQSYSGKRGLTSECVSRVKELIEREPHLAQDLDEKMKEAVVAAERALLTSTDDRIERLTGAILKARECFEGWGLISHELLTHMQLLSAQGALAVKPTGSGDGGFVLSLWDGEPPESVRKSLISV